MFNVRPDAYAPEFRVGNYDEASWESVDDRRATFPGADLNAACATLLDVIGQGRYGLPSAGNASLPHGTPALVPAPGGGSGGLGKCTLMPGIQQFGMCIYSCPDGSVRRSHDSPGRLGCRPWILPHEGLGL